MDEQAQNTHGTHGLVSGQGRPPFHPGPVTRWAPTSFAVDVWTVLRLCRYRRRESVEPAVWATAQAMTARAKALATPRAALRVLAVGGPGGDGVTLAGGTRFSGRAVGTLLAGCPLAVLFLLTLGPGLESEVAARTERRELLEAFLLDTAGWAAIEVAVRALRLELRAQAHAEGWQLTHRLAPGYRDWPLEEQRELLALFADDQDLVALTEHGLLLPLKSISGIFGLRPPGGPALLA